MYIHLPDQFVPHTSEELSSEVGAVLAQLTSNHPANCYDEITHTVMLGSTSGSAFVILIQVVPGGSFDEVNPFVT